MLAVPAATWPEGGAPSPRAEGKAGQGNGTGPPDLPSRDPCQFSNADLARVGDDRSTLLKNGNLRRFITWVAGKHPDLHAPTRSSR